MPINIKRNPNGREVCDKHIGISCPRDCWAVDRTLLGRYNGELRVARTFATAEAAHNRLKYELAWQASQILQYTDKGLPVPEHYSKWSYMLWDGTNA